jgi:hypothetical protein
MCDDAMRAFRRRLAQGVTCGSRFLRHVARESIAAFRFRGLFPLSKGYERRDPEQRDFAAFSGIRERRERYIGSKQHINASAKNLTFTSKTLSIMPTNAVRLSIVLLFLSTS